MPKTSIKGSPSKDIPHASLIGATPADDSSRSAVTLPASTAEQLGEVAQAKIRNYLHCFLVAITLAAYYFNPSISFIGVATTSVASLVAALGLYVWAVALQRGHLSLRNRLYQRSASIVSDNLFISLVLYLGGEALAGVWALYIWISVGYGVRYGVNYLRANVVVSLAAFGIVVSNTPFLLGRPAFCTGLALAMILVPLYTGWLITQLHSAVRERERAYRAKSDFVARMSHELRTPLHAIISTSEILNDSVTEAKHQDLTQIISVASTTLLDLINHVLDLSKFESGTVALARSELDLQSVVADTASIVFPQANRKGLDLKVYCDPKIDNDLVGAPQQLKEVLVNLFGNAAKFTDEGTISLVAELLLETPTKVDVQFRVSDTGPGIAESDIARIFEPFTQIDTSITRSHGGTGLGVPFAQELVRLMGGSMNVESTIGKGTIFEIRLQFEKQNRRHDIADVVPVRMALLSLERLPQSTLSLLDQVGARIEIFSDPIELANVLSMAGDEKRFDGILLSATDFEQRLSSVSRILKGAAQSRIIPIVTVGAPDLWITARTAGSVAHVSEDDDARVLIRALRLVAAFSHQVASSEPSNAPAISSKRLKILVADDDPTNRKVARLILEESGHACCFVDNGDDALFELHDHRYDLALLDMHMPGRDGIEVAKLFNFGRFDLSDKIPIILFTADATKAAREEAAAAGVTRFLTKPIRPSELLDAVATTYNEFSTTASGAESGSIVAEPAEADIVTTLNDASVADLLSFMTKDEQLVFFSEFEEDAIEYIDSLENLSSEADVARVREKMHALAGAAITVGAERLASLAKRIETADAAQLLIRQAQLLGEIRACFAETSERINREYLSVKHQ